MTVGALQADPRFNGNVNTSQGTLSSGDLNLGRETMPRIRVDLLIFNRQGLNFKADFAKLEYRWWFGGADTVLGLGAGAAHYKLGLRASASAWQVTGTHRVVLLRDA